MPSTEVDPCLLVWAWNTGLAIVPGGTLDMFEPVWCGRLKARKGEHGDVILTMLADDPRTSGSVGQSMTPMVKAIGPVI